MVFICASSICRPCTGQHGRTGIGVDLISAFRKCIAADVEYSFSEKLSVTAGAAFCLNGIPADKTLELTHNGEFRQESMTVPDMKDWHKERISLNCWADKAFTGLFTTVGVSYGSHSGIDCNAGIGFMGVLWKGLRLSARCGIDIFKGLSQEYRPAEHIEIGLKYVF